MTFLKIIDIFMYKIIQYNNNFTALSIFNFYLFHGLFDDVSVGSQFLHSTLSDIF